VLGDDEKVVAPDGGGDEKVATPNNGKKEIISYRVFSTMGDARISLPW
jgi:hypothetical protein